MATATYVDAGLLSQNHTDLSRGLGAHRARGPGWYGLHLMGLDLMCLTSVHASLPNRVSLWLHRLPTSRSAADRAVRGGREL